MTMPTEKDILKLNTQPIYKSTRSFWCSPFNQARHTNKKRVYSCCVPYQLRFGGAPAAACIAFWQESFVGFKWYKRDMRWWSTTTFNVLVHPREWTAKTKSKELCYKYRMGLAAGHSKYGIVMIPEGQATLYHGPRKGQCVPSGLLLIVIPFWIEVILGRKSTNKTKPSLGLRWAFGHYNLLSFINHKWPQGTNLEWPTVWPLLGDTAQHQNWVLPSRTKLQYRNQNRSNSKIFRSSNWIWIQFAASFLIVFSWWCWYTVKLLVSCCKSLIKSTYSKESHHCHLNGA